MERDKEPDTLPSPDARGQAKTTPRIDLILALGVVLIPLCLYWPASDFAFINSDDSLYITENRNVKKGLSIEGVIWAFTSLEAANWHPLTWLSHMLDVELFGLNAGGHHLTSVGLHTLNALLLLFFLTRTTGAIWPSAFAAALFSVHPLHVESVAWIAERKDVLCTLFGILACLAYTAYARRPSLGRYLVVVLFFAAGLMAKPMLVTLPCVFLLLDYWPLNRVLTNGTPENEDRGCPQASLGWALFEKIPLFFMTVASCWITWSAQAGSGAVRSLDSVPFSIRFANAIISYATYLYKTVWPFSLAFHYPLAEHIAWQQFWLALILIIGASIAVGCYARRFRYLLTGWLWYLGTLVPVIGLVQVGIQSHADRYTYIPLIGVFIIIAWGGKDIFYRDNKHMRRIASLIGGVSLFLLACLTWTQLGYWRSSASLYEQTLKVTERNFVIHSNLGLVYLDLGSLEPAVEQFERALEWNPTYVKAINNLGVAYAKMGRWELAKDRYLEALQIQPDYTRARFNLANLYMQKGQVNKAIEQYRLALHSSPLDKDVLNNLGGALYRQGDTRGAIHYFREAFRLAPEDSAVQINLGAALHKLGYSETALKIFEKIVKATPENIDALYNLALLYEKQQRMADADRYYLKVLKLEAGHQRAQAGRQRVQSLQPSDKSQ